MFQPNAEPVAVEPPPPRPTPEAVVVKPPRVTRVRTPDGIRVVPPEEIPKDSEEFFKWLVEIDSVPDDD